MIRRPGGRGTGRLEAFSDGVFAITITVVFYGLAFDVTALAFNAVWQYARRHGLLSEALDPAGATAIGRRFELALAWLAAGALLGAAWPVLGVAVIASFNAFYWIPIRGETSISSA